MSGRQPVEHSLKTWPGFFSAIKSGVKTFEVRKNDRDFRAGDTLRLRLYDPVEAAFGDEPDIIKTVSYVMEGGSFGLHSAYVVLAFAPDTARADKAEAERDEARAAHETTAADYHRALGYISTLTAERDALREGLEPFAKLTPPPFWKPDEGVNVHSSGWITVADIRRARSLLSNSQPSNGEGDRS